MLNAWTFFFVSFFGTALVGLAVMMGLASLVDRLFYNTSPTKSQLE